MREKIKYSMSKGMSPLLGALLLVAIVVAVTAIVGPAILDFAEEQTGEATERSIERADCTRAGTSIKNVTCDGTELEIEVMNTGYQELTGFRFQVLHEGSYHTYTFHGSEEILPPDGSRRFVNDSFVHDGAEEGRFFSETCPTATQRIVDENELSC